MSRNKIRKYILTILFFISFSSTVFAANYTWDGATWTNDGDTGDNTFTFDGDYNWGSDDIGELNSLTSSNSLTIATGVTVTFSTDCNISCSITNNGTMLANTGITLTISGSYTGSSDTINLDGGTFKNSTLSPITIENLTLGTTESTLDGEFTVSTITSTTGKLITKGNTSLYGQLDSLTIDSGTLTLTDALTVETLTNKSELLNDGKNITINTAYSGTGDKLTLSGGTVTYSGTTTATFGTVTIDENKSASINGDTQITITNEINAPTSVLTTDGTVSLKGTLAQLNVNSGTTTLNGNSTITTLSTTGETVLAGTLSVQDITIEASGKLTADANAITVSGDWTNNRGADGFDAGSSTVTFSGANKTVSGSQDFNTVKITGSTSFTAINTFASFICTTGGVTITFPAGTTTTSALNITGASGSLVTLASSSAWTLDAPTTSTLSYLTVSNCTATNELTANNSTDGGDNVGWNFNGQTYTWAGTNGASWSNKSNWSPRTIPGKGAAVLINTADSGPALSSAIDLGNGTITVDTGAVLDLNGFNLTAGTFTLKGKLRQKAEETITATKVFGTEYTLEYYGTAESKLKSTDFHTPIPNVIITDKQLRIMDSLTIKNLTNNKNLELQGNSLTVTNSYTSVADSIVSVNGGSFINSTENAVSIAKLALGTTESTLSGDFTVSAITTTSGKLKTTGNTSLYGQLDSLTIDSGKLTLTDTLTVETLTNKGELVNGGKNITINTAYSGTGDKLTLSGGTVTYSGTETATFGTVTIDENKSVLINGDTQITITNEINAPTSVLTTDGTVSLKGTLAQLNVNSGTTTLSGNSTITTLSITGETILGGTLSVQDVSIAAPTGKLTANANAITVSGDWTNSRGVYGFDAGGNTVTFTPGDNDSDSTSTLTGSTTFYNAIFNGKTDLAAANEFTTLHFEDNAEGTINTVQTVNGTTYIQNNTVKSLTFSAENIFESGVQIGNTGMHPSYAGTITLKGKTSSGAMNIITSANATQLTINSPVILSCNVTTTETQTYNEAVTLNQNLSLSGSTITLENTVDSDTTERALTVIGNVEFKAPIGSINQLDLLSVMTANSTDTTKISTNLIKTLGTQTYNGAVLINEDTQLTASNIKFVKTVDDATDSTHTLTITGNSEFHDIVGDTNKLKKLIADSQTSTVTINTTAITTSDLQSYAGPVTISQNETLTATTITFSNTVTATEKTLTLNNTTTNIAADITASTITDNGNVNFTTSGVNLTATTVDFSGTTKTVDGNAFTVTGNLTNSGTVTYKVPQTITGNLTNSGTFTANANANTNLAGNFTDTGTWTAAAGTTITLDGTTTDGRTFVPGAASTYENITLNTNAQSVTFTDAATLNVNNTFTITKAAKTQFNGTTTIGTFTDTTDSLQLVINAPISIYSSTTINTPDIQAKSSLTTSENLTVNGETTLTGDFEYKTLGTGNSVSITKKLSGSHNLTITSSNNITLSTANVSTSTCTIDAQGTITLQESTVGVSTLTFKDAGNAPTGTSSASITLNNVTIQADNRLTIPFNTTLTGTTAISMTAPQIVFPNFSSTIRTLNIGTVPLTLNGYTMFNGTLTRTDTGTGTFTVNGDLIINNDQTNTTTLNAPVTIKKATSSTLETSGNLVVYNGTLSVGANITIENDLVFFGANYNTTDQESGISNIYYYYYATESDKGLHPMHGRFSITSHSNKLPDNTDTPIKADGAKESTVSAALQTTDGITIQVDQSFFANGLTATGSTNWNLKLRKNKLTSANFAQAYYCNFTGSSCNVSCYETGAAADAVKIAAEQCTVKSGYEAGWDLDDFVITETHTVHDNIIKVTLNRAISNADNILNTESTTNIKNPTRIDSAEGSYSYIYKTVDFNTITHAALPAEETLTKTEIAENADDVTEIYIKTSLEHTWNTDATGSSAGNTNSTDTHGRHKTNIPYLDIQRNESGTNGYNYYITDLWGKRIKQYSNANSGTTRWTNVTDQCSPVIVSVKTGQERHTVYDTTAADGVGGQPSCDSHNFIEFRYSEPVNFYDDSAPAATPFIAAKITADTPNTTDNIQATSNFGEITNNATGFTVKGLGTLANGKIMTGQNGTQTSLVNAFYKNNFDANNQYEGDIHSIRLSIAGYTNGTATDRDGNVYKKWVGYIDEAVTPYGAYTLYNPDSNGLNAYVRDLVGNCEKSPSVPVNVNSQTTDATPTPSGLYSEWDTSAPVFTPARLKVTADWETTQFSEAVGASNGSTLDRVEFHFFDNAEDTTTAVWFTQKGWCDPNSTLNRTPPQPTLYDEDYTYCADIIGGSRPYYARSGETTGITANTQTTGGIRFSTKENINSYFKYAKGSGTPSTAFGTDLYPKVTSSIFTGPSQQRRSNDDPDGLYLGLSITEASLPVETTFTVKYDQAGFLTDLAGNRLRTATISTIDRTPPSIDMCLSPINQDELFIIIVKELTIESSLLSYKDDTTGNDINITQTYEQLLPYCFELMSLDATGTKATSTLSINTNVPAKIETFQAPAEEGSTTQKSTFTYIRLKLNRNITLADVENLYVRLIAPTALGYPETSKDPITNITGSRVTLIQDPFGNYMSMFTAHAISDFLIGGVTPLYAYDTDMTYGEETVMNGLYEDGSWAVHDWNAEQQNYGTLPANHPIALTASLDDGTETKQNVPNKVRLYFTNQPDAESVSKQYNYDFNRQLRIWLPNLTNGLFPGLAHDNNTNYLALDSQFMGEKASDGLIWNIDKETTSTWASGDQVSFLFGLLKDDGTPVRIYNAPYFNATDSSNNNYDFTRSTAVPLYSLRLLDPADILSLDLWSFRVRSISEQRGGVTVLNNVINSTTGEKTVLKVNMPSDGKLNVIVMTLDGNIVQYLAHGQTTAGEHYYSWNGKNQKGSPVARGMYFVRVVGNGIDETRKVMVVK